jgi:hypothetical protein
VPNVCGADVMRTSNFALKPIKLTLFEATEADLAATPKTPILKSQRTPKDFRNPTIKADRKLTRNSSYVAEFVSTPIRLEDVAIELSEEEAAMLDRLRLPVYGADDGAALRDILFTWWEQKFLGAARERRAGDRRQEDLTRRDRRPLLRRRAVPLPDYPVAPGDREAVRRQPAGLAKAGHAVSAEGLSLEQSAIFIHAIDFTALDAGIGVGEAATEGADIITCEPREGLRRYGRDESDAQPQRQAQPADPESYDETRDLHSIPHATGSTRAMRPVLMALSRRVVLAVPRTVQ